MRLLKDTLKIKDKVVCIMGGTGLIGNILTKGFADCGGRVLVGTRTPEKYSNKTKEKSKKDQDLIQILMGDEVAPRKNFIINRALEVANLDI